MEPNSIEKIVEIDSHIGKWKDKGNVSYLLHRLTEPQIWMLTGDSNLRLSFVGLCNHKVDNLSDWINNLFFGYSNQSLGYVVLTD